MSLIYDKSPTQINDKISAEDSIEITFNNNKELKKRLKDKKFDLDELITNTTGDIDNNSSARSNLQLVDCDSKTPDANENIKKSLDISKPYLNSTITCLNLPPNQIPGIAINNIENKPFIEDNLDDMIPSFTNDNQQTHTSELFTLLKEAGSDREYINFKEKKSCIKTSNQGLDPENNIKYSSPVKHDSKDITDTENHEKTTEKSSDIDAQSIKTIANPIDQDSFIDLKKLDTPTISSNNSSDSLNTQIKTRKNQKFTTNKSIENCGNELQYQIAQEIDPLEFYEEELKNPEIQGLSREENKEIVLVCLSTDISLQTLKLFEEKNFIELSKWFYPTELDIMTSSTQNSFFAGSPTCIEVFNNSLYYIGTKTGAICVFDSKEKLIKKFEFKATANIMVTILSVSEDGLILLAGYENGTIAVIDLVGMTDIKIITGKIKGKILTQKILKSAPFCALIADSNGNISYLELEKFIASFYKVNIDELYTDKVLGEVYDIVMMPSHIIKSGTMDYEQIEYLASLLFLLAPTGITVISVMPFPKVQYTMSKPDQEGISDTCLPLVALGIGSISLDNKSGKKLLCLVCWGSKLILFEIIYQNSSISFMSIGEITLESEINYITWISEEVIFLIDEYNRMILMNCREFIRSRHLMTKEAKFGNLGSKPYDANKKINSQNYAMYSEQFGSAFISEHSVKIGRIKLNYLQPGIKFDYLTRELFCITHRNIIKLKVLNATDYLNQLFDTNRLLEFFNLGYAIWRKAIHEIPDIPNDSIQRKPKFNLFFKNTIEKNLNALLANDKNENKKTILACVDFLMAIDNQEFLFKVLMPFLTEQNYGDHFLDCLEPYLQKNLITKIPHKDIISIVGYYCSKGKSSLMQKMLLKINLDEIEKYELMALCLHYNLYASLIYICKKYNRDFITPFGKLLSSFTKEMAQGLTESTKSCGYRLLWYIKFCFKKSNIVTIDSSKNNQLWQEMVLSIIMSIFTKQYIIMLFQLDLYTAINLVLLIYYGELGQLLDEPYHKTHLIEEDDDESTEETKGFLEEIFDLVEDILLNNKIDLFLDHDEIHWVFGFFLSKAIESGRCGFIKAETCYEMSKFLIKYFSKMSIKVIILNFKYFLPIYNEKGMQNNSKSVLESTINEYWIHDTKINLITILLTKANKMLLVEDNMNEMILLAVENYLKEIECFLYYIKGEYIKGLEIYILTKNQKVFNFIDQTMIILSYSSDDTRLDEFRKKIINNINELADINSKKTHCLVETHLRGEVLEVLKNIGSTTYFHLEILDQIFEEGIKGDRFEYDEEAIVKYFRLLCTYGNKKKIIKFLQSNIQYPMSQSIELVKQYQIKSAIAMLEAKQGNLTRTFQLRHEILEDYLKKIIDTDDKDLEKIQKKLTKKFRKIFDYLNCSTQDEKYWFDCLEKIYQIADKYSNKHETTFNPMICQILDDLVDQFILELIKTYQVKPLLQDIQPGGKYSTLTPSLSKRLLKKLILFIAYEKYILDAYKRLVADELSFKQKKFEIKSYRALQMKQTCGICLRDIAEHEKSMIFGCQHLFHLDSNCLKERKDLAYLCPICSKSEAYMIMNLVHIRSIKTAAMRSDRSAALRKNEENARKTPNEVQAPIIPDEKKRKLDKIKCKLDYASSVIESSREQVQFKNLIYQLINLLINSISDLMINEQ